MAASDPMTYLIIVLALLAVILLDRYVLRS